MTPVLVSQEEAIELSPTERSARVESLKEEGNTLAEGGTLRFLSDLTRL